MINLVKVTFKPWEEVIIHENIEYNIDDLVKQNSIGVQPGGLARPLRWTRGVAFTNAGMPPTDEIVREQLQGRIHWNVVSWALMPEYKNVILIKDINAKMPVINVSGNTILSEVAEALKANTKHK